MPQKYNIRRFVQIFFTLIVVRIGVQFHQFVSQLEIGIIPQFSRPPGVEAFLPIGSLVSLKHFLFTGHINQIHPSGLILFLIICLTALVAKKAFCSWICPIGLFSDYLTKLHNMIFKNSFIIPAVNTYKWIDHILRSLKYIIAGFFVWSIFFKMPMNSIEQFIQSPYNRFADIKMYYFFSRISPTALMVILVLLILSIIIQNFWCRYLCPYGALLGIISFFSVGRIYRNRSHCTDCGKCEKHCPGMIKIRQKEVIHSSECSGCLTCVQKCPEQNAIGFRILSGKFGISPSSLAIIIVLLFFLGISTAKLSGNWENDISKPQYLRYVLQNNSPWNSQGPMDSETRKKMMTIMKNIQAQKEKGLLPNGSGM